MGKDTRHHAPRKPGHDYTAAGICFVTVCTQHGLPLFGDVRDGEMHLSPAGDMLVHWWGELAHKYATVTPDTFIVMPNHIHGLLGFGQTGAAALPDVMRWYKAMTTNAYMRGVREANWPRFPGKLWQRSYYDHIVRDAPSLDRIRRYIHHNPVNWHRDRFNRTSA